MKRDKYMFWGFIMLELWFVGAIASIVVSLIFGMLAAALFMGASIVFGLIASMLFGDFGDSAPLIKIKWLRLPAVDAAIADAAD